nr:MAG TPA: actin-like protein [Caudoviricetes sp.]
MDFHSMSIGSSPLCPIFYAVNLMPKPIFWMHTELKRVSSTLTTVLCPLRSSDWYCCNNRIRPMQFR